MTSPTRRHASCIWRRANPSRCMAFMALIYLSRPDSPERRLAARWIIDFGAASRLNFMATMASMFGSRWLQSSDHRVLSLRNLSASDCLNVDPSEAGLWTPFMLCMVGQVRVEGLVELIRDNPLHWERDLPRVRAIPGSDRLLSDIQSILEGRADEVSWAMPAATGQPSVIRGLTDRNVRSLRPGDAIILDPASRLMSLSELLKRSRAVALRCSDDRRLFTVETTEYPETGNFCVAIRRRS
jgi:hypothetical protein